MKKSLLLNKYLKNYSVGETWQLIANDTDHISQVVVIPAYAEREMLFSTLASLARNTPAVLASCLVICVVNNQMNSPDEVKKNNLQTMECLESLIKKQSLHMFCKEEQLHQSLTDIGDANMKLGYINASTPGYEIPQRVGGVGMARKIGMDTALRLLGTESATPHVILSLDADTLVQDHYLSAIRHDFTKAVKTAIVAYEHQMPSDDLEKAAICCYEIFLRYWVLGLKYAKSPWAFHSIGSTITVSTDAYLEVRGMNRRAAGEDFYFLNKLAKVSNIDYIKDTCVYPSARASTRVPFGTGKRIQRFLSGTYEKEYYLYDPKVFLILAAWLQLMEEMILEHENQIVVKAGCIHPRLKIFLDDNQFPMIWSKIRRVAREKKLLVKHFHDWFDGFRTLKLIHDLTREVYPLMDMFAALESMLSLSGISSHPWASNTKVPPLWEQMECLDTLRTIT
jgi:hypothetical protein